MRKLNRGVQFYLDQIDAQYPDFKDDGLSGGFPDWLYSRWDLWKAGRVHDWHYCSRCHPQGSMDQDHRRRADRLLRQHARELLPWFLQIAPIVLYWGVRLGGGTEAWHSCGPIVGERCRHNILMPGWMKEIV